MEKVTVVIPNYNGKKYIAGCLNSLALQREEFESFGVVVVDNGSTDGSLEQIRMEYPWVRLITLTSNTGFCHAVNQGIRTSQAPYVILLNNDTEVKSGFIKSLHARIESDRNIFSVSGKMLMWDSDDRIDDAGDRYCVLGWAYSRGKGKPAADFEKPTEVFAACAGAAIYRKSILEEIGYFDEMHFAYMEDIDIGYRARIYGYRNYYEPSACIRHAGSASSGSRYNPFKTKHSSANNVYMIWKNMPIFQLLWNLPFLIPGFLMKYIYFIRKKMGMLYLCGLWEGIKKCSSAEGKDNKIRYNHKHFKNYIQIQLQLYADTLRLFSKN